MLDVVCLLACMYIIIAPTHYIVCCILMLCVAYAFYVELAGGPLFRPDVFRSGQFTVQVSVYDIIMNSIKLYSPKK